MKTEEETRKFLLGVQASEELLKKLGVSKENTAFAIVALKWVLEDQLNSDERKMLGRR